MLDVVVSPWARVFVDGRPLGQTPRKVRLPAGPHQLELVNKELGRRVVTTIQVRAGETHRIRKQWDR